MILCVKLKAGFNSGKQYSNHNMYEYGFNKCVFIDTFPNFNIKYGNGRIIQFQWNEFLRKIKRYLWKKKKGKETINKFWKEERKISLLKNTVLPEKTIDIISSYCN